MTHLTEGTHYQRITGNAQEFVTIGDEKCYFYLAANGKWGLVRCTHPEAYDEYLLEAGEMHRRLDMAAINKARRLNNTC